MEASTAQARGPAFVRERRAQEAIGRARAALSTALRNLDGVPALPGREGLLQADSLCHDVELQLRDDRAERAS
jgi:hypothetical protein